MYVNSISISTAVGEEPDLLLKLFLLSHRFSPPFLRIRPHIQEEKLPLKVKPYSSRTSVRLRSPVLRQFAGLPHATIKQGIGARGVSGARGLIRTSSRMALIRLPQEVGTVHAGVPAVSRASRSRKPSGSPATRCHRVLPR